jgi:protein transport protein SEC24
VPTTGGGIQQQAGTALPRIGVCLYSANGVFIHARHGRGQHAIASDVTEQPFCPLPLSDWTFELASEDGLRDWIGFLTGTLIHDIALGKEQLKGGNAYGLDSFDLSPAGAALHFVSDALRESGGRGTVLTWRRPNFGVGRLSHREERKAPAAGKIEDYTPYTPVQVLSKFKTPDDEAAATFYKKLGTECVSNRVSLDVVMHCDSTMGQTFFDLATLGELCRATCGSLLWLPSSDDWQGALEEALRHRVRRFEGYDAVFKLRTSTGIQVKSFLCNPGVVQESMLGSQELELSSVSAGTTIAVELDYRVGGIPKNNKLVVLQSALLYTTVQGKRRVRVSTLALPVSSSSREIFRSIDFSATAVMILRTNAARLHQIPAEENATPPRANARASVYHECLHVLTSYRRVSGSLAGAEQLLLPEALQLLPLFVMSLMKSPLLRPTLIMNPSFRPGRAFQGPAATVQSVVIRPSGDDRAYLHTYASQAGPATAMLLVYPRIYPVSGLESGAGDWVASPGPESSGYVYLPHPLRPSMEVLQDDGMYLIDSGLRIFLWMGKSVPESVKDQARSQPLWEWNPVAHRILWQLLAFNNADRGHPSEVRPVHPPLLNVFVRDGMPPTPTDSMVLDLTIEDAIGGEKEYQEFFMRIQNSIRNQLKAQQ